MISLLILLFSIKLNSHLVIENLALRQQLAIMKQSIKQHKVTSHQRYTLPAGHVNFSDRPLALFNSRSEECNVFNRGSDLEKTKNP